MGGAIENESWMCLINQMRKLLLSILILLAFPLLGINSKAFAQLLTHSFVTVGDTYNLNYLNGFGQVNYSYGISKFETTISQYTTFLNAVAREGDTYNLYQSSMVTDTKIRGINRTGSSGNYSYSVVGGSGNKPITYVSWFDAARYVNWLHNGAVNGASTETGAYELNGAMSGDFSRTAQAKYALPDRNEWVKAGYFDPNKINAGMNGWYWKYPNQADSITTAQANFYNNGFPYIDANGNYLTEVGYFSNQESSYGTFDQGGNVFEWLENPGSQKILAGGSWSNIYAPGAGNLTLEISGSLDQMQASPTGADSPIGFRVLALVPEPSSLSLLALGGVVVALRRRR